MTTGDVDEDKIHYCERFLELMIDLEAQLPTRRFFNLLLDGAHVVVRSQQAALVTRDDGKLFSQVSCCLGLSLNQAFRESCFLSAKM